MLKSIVILIAALLATSCASRPPAPRESSALEIRQRTLAQFARAVLLKPKPHDATNKLAHQLAPLLLIEATQASTLSHDASNAPSVELFHQSNSVTLNGKPHTQFTYWWQPPAATGQGVRTTLDADGRPVIWEVVADPSGARVIYVSESLEVQARKEFGGPLPGRQFALEQSPTKSPNVVIARALADGPLSMGPIIHLRSNLHEVTTVICRCMPSQARELLGHGEYQLTPALMPDKLTAHFNDLGTTLRLPLEF